MDNFLTVTATGVSITSGLVSAGSALPVASSGEIPRYVRIAASLAACVRIGVGAQTAVATDLLVQPGDAVVLAVPRGCTHVAAIQLAAAGVVIVSPCEDC